MRIRKLAGVMRNAVALLVLTGALVTALPAYFAPQGYVTRAACTKVGTASVDPDGIPRCDCTIIETSGNCACVITCPKPQND